MHRSEAMKRRPSLASGLWLGAVTSLAAIALSYMADTLWGLPNVSFDLFEWLTRVLPGGLVALGVHIIVAIVSAIPGTSTASAAKVAEQMMAVALGVVVGAGFGFVLALIGRHVRVRLTVVGALGGLALAVAAMFMEASLGFRVSDPILAAAWLAGLLVLWGALLGKGLDAGGRGAPAAPAAGRRRAIGILTAGAVGVAGLAFALGRLLGPRRRGASGQPELLSTAGTSGPAASPPRDVLAARFPPVQGTRPELTRNENFYRIDINLVPPRVSADSWRLEVGGLVDRPLSLTLEDLRARPAVSQVITLECISNRVGGDLISTSRWTGVRLGDVLREAGLQRGAGAVFIEAVDGFYESVEMPDAFDERTLLVYDMNGVPLPPEHGFPLRIYIPNRYGMKQPKWIRSLEAIAKPRPGYWVERGWDREAIPTTTSVIDALGMSMKVGETATIPIGGIAYAGARGVSKVEVQVDDGPWREAELRAPPLGPLTWVQWRYFWPYRPGRHTFRVRAYDGTGALQPVKSRGPRPSGATGIFSITTSV